ncbi:VWA domain-containing protein [Gallaecimonas kandeliae]|uniref:VWA domain-containing protein n=1 Tax=Gallaecimonas kandeliae TaxID=3029055 RepID=UPI002647DDA1|nr:VWA domain-containing protein [Gallaecimonas kandeliae]WKE64183.1 VWA domain-containing protein [Gallaecimonas kandeliae]
MLEFEALWVLLLLPLPLLWALLPAHPQPSLTRLKVPMAILAQADAETQGVSRRLLPAWLKWVGWLLLLAALARPVWVGAPVSLPDSRREMTLVLDLSGSMQETDMEYDGHITDRLSAAKGVLLDFIKKRKGDRLGLILFADHAYVQAPLSYDLRTIATLMEEAQQGLVGTRTAIGEAVALATKQLAGRKGKKKVAILLTDGHNTAGGIDPLDALAAAKEKGVTFYTIGFGSDYQIKRTIWGNRKAPNEDPPDEAFLTRLAEETGGKYFRARDAKSLEAIYGELNNLEPLADNQQTLRPRKDIFFWPLGLLLLLSAAVALWRTR